MPAKRKLIGQVLLERGMINEEQLKTALARKERWGKRLGENLVDLGFISEKQLVKILGEIYRRPTVDIETAPVADAALKLIPADFCRKHHIIPITIKKISGRDHLVVAISDPSNVEAIDELRYMVSFPIFEVLSTTSGIDAAVRKHHRTYGAPYFEERKEVTLTRGKEDSSMEIIHDGDVQRVKSSEIKELPRPSPDSEKWEKVFHALVQLLVARQIISEEEGRRLISM